MSSFSPSTSTCFTTFDLASIMTITNDVRYIIYRRKKDGDRECIKGYVQFRTKKCSENGVRRALGLVDIICKNKYTKPINTEKLIRVMKEDKEIIGDVIETGTPYLGGSRGGRPLKVSSSSIVSVQECLFIQEKVEAGWTYEDFNKNQPSLSSRCKVLIEGLIILRDYTVSPDE